MKQSAWILGYFGRTNLGDELLLASVLDNIPVWAAPCVLTSNEAQTREIHHVRCVLCPPLSRLPNSGSSFNFRYWLKKGPRLFLDILRNKPCIYACGGSITDHVAGLTVRVRETANTLKHMHCRVGMIGAGVDPLTLPDDREAARELISHELEYCSVRDAGSVKNLLELGVPQNCFHEGADLAYAIRKPDFPQKSTVPDTLTNSHIGLNLKPLFCTPQERGDRKALRHENYRQDCIKLIRRLKAMAKKITLVPYSKEDNFFLSELARENDLPMMPFTPNPRIRLQEMGVFDLFVGMRYHSVVFSVLANTPTVPIVYAPKVEMLAIELGFDAQMLAVGDGTEMVDRQLDIATICHQVELVWQDRQNFTERMSKIYETKRNRAIADMQACWESLSRRKHSSP